jgi:dienelactone hydrolase
VKVAVVALLALALAGCGGGGGSAGTHSVTFTSGGVRVDAFVVTPSGGGRHPAVVLVHGAGGNRSELLKPARDLAAKGIVAMTITEPSTSHPPKPVRTVTALLAETKASALADAAAVSRAADVLSARSDVDPKRLGYLGWSAGAKTGALVAARDARFKALALLSGGAQPVASFVAAAPPPYRAAVRKTLTEVDPLTALSHARAGTILLEDGRRDAIVPRAALENFIHAAPPSTVVRWYPAGHPLDRTAFRDAEQWLRQQLAQ